MTGSDPIDTIERVYAVGDVHGRFDLFRALMRAIERDHAAREPVATRIILLGDIVDRGPDSARLVLGCRQLCLRNPRFTVLKGNHEEMMVQALRGDLWTYRAWLDFGGRETLQSWGAAPELTDGLPSMRHLRAAAKLVGRDVIDWLAHLPLSLRHEDHLFVHAGVRPGVALDRQTAQDLLWIDEEFLEADGDLGAIVVHGHSIVEDGPDVRTNRIGIDTGAYRTGRLTALGVERGTHWVLQVDEAAEATAPERTTAPAPGVMPVWAARAGAAR